jgi:hypothetical protein
VYRSLLDRDAAVLVGRFFGPANTDDDFERYIASIREADQAGLTKPGGVAILLVERGNPMPNAHWRRRIADDTAHIQSKDALFVLCTEDPLIRGVLTAINWLRPPKYEVRVVGSVEALRSLLAQRRPASAARAAALIAQVRADPG